ncbi:MAG: glycosyltransferase [Cyanobacteria bacterium P01_A01_bin.17]
MTSPRFTFCIPNLNKIQYLPICIDSVLSQDSDIWECVIVDGFSSDGSWDYLQQFASDSRFKILRGLKQGMYADWNECLKHVDTEYFYFLPSDDVCNEDLVSKTTLALDSQPDIDACHFQFNYIDEQGQVTRSYDQILRSQLPLYSGVSHYAHRRSAHCEFMMHFVYRTVYRTMNSLVFRRNIIEKMNGFSSSYGSAGDYDWSMRLSFYTDVLYIPELLAAWRRYDEQATQAPGSPQNFENIIKIAAANLEQFLQLDSAHYLCSQIDKQNVLAHLKYKYRNSVYRNSIQKDLGKDSTPSDLNMRQALFARLVSFRGFSLRFFARLTRYRLFSYVSEKGFSRKLLHDLRLTWPPVSVDWPLDR